MKTPFHLLLLKTFSAQRNEVRPYMAEVGLSPGQPKILSYLRRHNNCMQKDLALFSEIEPATVSRLLENMEKNGLIERKTAPESRRAACVCITEKGLAAHDKMERFFEAVDKKSMSGFTPEEQEQFCRYLCRMYHNLTGGEID